MFSETLCYGFPTHAGYNSGRRCCMNRRRACERGTAVEVDLRHEQRLLHPGRARHHGAVRGADERLAAERQALLAPDPVAQRDEISILERGDLHLSFVQALGPLVERTRLRHDDQLGASDRERAHVFGVVTVVADSDADGACLRPVDRGAGIPRRVVALLVEAWIVGDVDHPRASEDRTVGVDDRRAIVGTLAIALVQIQDDDDPQLARLPRERVGQRPGNRLGEPPRFRRGRMLRMESLEGELGEGNDRRARARRPLQRRQPPAHVVLFVGGGLLLDERDFHPRIIWRLGSRVLGPTKTKSRR